MNCICEYHVDLLFTSKLCYRLIFAGFISPVCPFNATIKLCTKLCRQIFYFNGNDLVLTCDAKMSGLRSVIDGCLLVLRHITTCPINILNPADVLFNHDCASVHISSIVQWLQMSCIQPYLYSITVLNILI